MTPPPSHRFDWPARPRSPQRRRARLGLLFSSIASAAVASCGAAQLTTKQSPETPRESTLIAKGLARNMKPVCDGDTISLAEGLKPAVAIDSLSFYPASTMHLCHQPEYDRGTTGGYPCQSSQDHEACLEEVERLKAGSADWGTYETFWTAHWGLFVVTGTAEAIKELGGPQETLMDGKCSCRNRKMKPAAHSMGGAGGAAWAAEVVSDEATTLRDLEGLKNLLGEIDTPNEAAIIMWAHGYGVGCEVRWDEGRFVAQSKKLIGDCPMTTQNFELTVDAAGKLDAQPVGEPKSDGSCAGRRPHGLCAAPQHSALRQNNDQAWLRRVVRLETAAVAAFASLATQLERHGAPANLQARAWQAADDEVRHAKEVHELLSEREATPQSVRVRREPERSLLSLAVENATEGCVRECWGALVAHYQSQTATDPRVRQVWAKIAEDESDHAALSMDLAGWFRSQLSEEQSKLVEQRHREAVESLRSEACAGRGASIRLGLPNKRAARHLFAELERVVFQPHPANYAEPAHSS